MYCPYNEEGEDEAVGVANDEDEEEGVELEEEEVEDIESISEIFTTLIQHSVSMCMYYYDVLWHIMMHSDALWCIMMHYDILWCIMMHYDVLWMSQSSLLWVPWDVLIIEVSFLQRYSYLRMSIHNSGFGLFFMILIMHELAWVIRCLL